MAVISGASYLVVSRLRGAGEGGRGRVWLRSWCAVGEIKRVATPGRKELVFPWQAMPEVVKCPQVKAYAVVTWEGRKGWEVWREAQIQNTNGAQTPWPKS